MGCFPDMDDARGRAAMKRRKKGFGRKSAAARKLLDSKLYLRLEAGEDMYGALLLLWRQEAGYSESDMIHGVIAHACHTRDGKQLAWALESIAECGQLSNPNTPTPPPTCAKCGKGTSPGSRYCYHCRTGKPRPKKTNTRKRQS